MSIAMDEWTEFRGRGLGFDSKIFVPMDVLPDGDCFYHSVVASQVLPTIPTAGALRHALVDEIIVKCQSLQWRMVFGRILASSNSQVSLYQYLNGLRVPGTWGTDIEMVFIYVAFGINICSISNATYGFACFDAKNYIELLRICLPPGFVDMNQCVYLYHHTCGRPLTPTHAGNHFCVLFEINDEKSKVALEARAYRGGVARFQTVNSSVEAWLNACTSKKIQPMLPGVKAKLEVDPPVKAKPIAAKNVAKPVPVSAKSITKSVPVLKAKLETNPPVKAEAVAAKGVAKPLPISAKSETKSVPVLAKSATKQVPISGKSSTKKVPISAKSMRTMVKPIVSKKAVPKAKPVSEKTVRTSVVNAKKQKTLINWLPNVPSATKEQIARLEENARIRKELDKVGSKIIAESIPTKTQATNSGEAKDVGKDDDDDDDSSKVEGTSGSAVRIKSRLERKELPWSTKGHYIYFHLHPLLGNGNYAVTCALFSLNEMTLRNWLKKPERIQKWVPLVDMMKLTDVLNALPEKVKGRYELVVKPPYPELDTSQYHKIIRKVKCPVVFLHNKPGVSAKKIASLAKKTPGKAVFIRAGSKRIVTVPVKRNPKHMEVKEFVRATISERWLQGLAITKPELLLAVVKEFGKRNDEASKRFMEVYGRGTQGRGNAKLNMFLQRAIKQSGYSVRQKSISQKIPMDWRKLAEDGARRVRETFLRENVDVVVAADEMFIRFHEEDSRVLAPIGEKRIGKSVTTDHKAGCTVLPTMDMMSSQLLPPLIIFNGVFGGRLMKQWAQHTNSFVLFTENHWMTTETMVLYLKKLMTFYKGKTIGVIIDKAPSHTNERVDEWVAKLNEEDDSNTKIVLEWVDGGLTSIYQPGDIAVNKPLKSLIKDQYYAFITENREILRPGDRVRVPRERLVQFIENSFSEFNEKQRKKRAIAQAFRTCGLDPFADTDRDFTEHLDKLQGCKVYENLLDGGKALHLDRKAPSGM